jgi:hypothetical protein
MPHDYKRVLVEQEMKEAAQRMSMQKEAALAAQKN